MPEPPLLAVDEDQRQSDDNRRDHERQVDDPVDQRAPAERPPLERERAGDAEDGVERNRDRHHEQRELERVERIVRRERVDERADAMLERAIEHHPDRQRQQHGEVAERDAAQRQP